MQIRRTELDGLNGTGLTALVVDARPFIGKTRVYIGDANGRGYLTVFDPDRSVWYKVPLSHHRTVTTAADDGQSDDDADVAAECLTVSKFRSCVFLTSAQSRSFYSASFRDLRDLTSDPGSVVKVRKRIVNNSYPSSGVWSTASFTISITVCVAIPSSVGPQNAVECLTNTFHML